MALSVKFHFTANPDVVYQMQWATTPKFHQIVEWVMDLPIFRSRAMVIESIHEMITNGVAVRRGNGLILEVSQ